MGNFAIQHCHHAWQFQKAKIKEATKTDIADYVRAHVLNGMLQNQNPPLQQMRNNSKYIVHAISRINIHVR